MPDKMDKPRLTREQIAQRAALELPDGAYVNLGWGIPNLISDYLPAGITVFFHSENGILGMGRRARAGEEDFDLVDAMKVPVTLVPGASFFNQADAHLMTRGGHLDVAVLGGFQVSEKGDLANWKIPGAKGSGGIGGAMDIASGTKTVVVCMEHTTRDGAPKIVRECTYPLTGLRCVTTIVTDLAVDRRHAERPRTPRSRAAMDRRRSPATHRRETEFRRHAARNAPQIKMRSMYRIRIAHSLRTRLPHSESLQSLSLLVAPIQRAPARPQRNGPTPTHLSPDLLTQNAESRSHLNSSSAARRRATHSDHSPLRPRRLRAASLRSFRRQRQSLFRIRASRIQKRRHLSRSRRTRPSLDHRQASLIILRYRRIDYDVDVAKMERDIFSAADTSKIREGYVGLLGYSIFAFLKGHEDLADPARNPSARKLAGLLDAGAANLRPQEPPIPRKPPTTTHSPTLKSHLAPNSGS